MLPNTTCRRSRVWILRSRPGCRRRRVRGPELSIIVPTFNERDNIAELIGRLVACLGDRSWEVVFVDDDSPDGTADLVREHAAADSRIRCLRRIGRRGLSSACVEGMLATTARLILR